MKSTKEKAKDTVVQESSKTNIMQEAETNTIKEKKTETTIIQEEENNKVKKQKNIFSKIIGGFFKLLGILIIILVIIFIIRAVVYKKYDVFGCRFYMIMSGSMEPTIQVGDAVITKETNDLKTGDVVAFQNNSNATVVHRIIKTYTEGESKLYQTQGDNNNAPDKGLIKNENIKGKVLVKIPKAGQIILYLQKHIYILIIPIVGAIIIISLVRRLL